MKILFVNQSFYPDQSASARYLSDLACALVQQGHEVHVLTSSQGYLNTEEHYAQDESWQGIYIHRIAPQAHDRSGRWRRAFGAFGACVRFARALRRFPQCDLVIPLTSPPLIASVVAAFTHKPRIGIVPWIMDLNPDQAFAAGWIKEKSLLGLALRYALNYSLRRALAIITLDRFMAERIQSSTCKASLQTNQKTNKVHVLPLWCDRELFPVAHTDNPFRETLHAEDKFVVMYSGNFSLCHPFATILQAAEALRDRKDICFRFIGGGARLQELLSSIAEKSLHNVQHFPYEKKENLAHSLSAADVHIISFGDAFCGIVHPSKIYGVLAVHRPFILVGSQETFIAEEFVSRGLGVQIPHGDVSGLVQNIVQMATTKNAQTNTQAWHEKCGEICKEYAQEKRLGMYTSFLNALKPGSNSLNL